MTRKTLDEITLEDFKAAISTATNDGHTNIAPLGMSGETICLHEKGSRVQQVSIRLYCGDPELLITNQSKSFLFYGRYDFRMGFDFVAQEYFRIFTLLKNMIPLEDEEKTKMEIADNAELTKGFDILRKASIAQVRS